MRRRSVAATLLAALVVVAAPGETAVRDEDESLALIGVTLLDPLAEAPKPAATVLVVENVIAAVGEVGEVELGQGTRRIDASGLYLLPGLWDLHTHLTHTDASVPPLLVTQGVLGVRNCGSELDKIESLRERVHGGELLGPRIVRAGPTLNGGVYGTHQRLIETAEDARAAVAELAQVGVDFLKTHNQTSREAYFALLEAAREHELPVVGHVPATVDPLEACAAGQSSVEHIATLFEGTYLARFDNELAAFVAMPKWLEDEAEELVVCFAKHETLFVPTLRAYDVRAHWAAIYDSEDPRRRFLSAEQRKRWEDAVPNEMDRKPEVIEFRESLVDAGRELVRRLHAAGAPIGAGTDLAGAGLLPGFSLHAELELLASAGLTPREALETSARGPGEAAGGHPLQGRLVAGAPADLVLLRENAFEDLAALSAIEGIVLRGRYLDRAELDAVLKRLEGLSETSAH